MSAKTKSDHLTTGEKGEDIACKLLQKKGYKILSRNYRCRFGEIDVIAKKNKTLYFVEVKTRHNIHFGKPEESVTPTKLTKFKKTIFIYLQDKKQKISKTEILIFSILINEGKVKYKMFRLES